MVAGQPKIADAEQADREWEANTRPRVDQPPARSARARAGQPPEGEPSDRSAGPAPVASIPDYFVSRALREGAAARREAALADLAELDVRQRTGELVPVAEARQAVIDKFSVVRTKILGVPSRVGQRAPDASQQIIQLIDDLRREALEELANGGDDDES